MGQSTGLEGYYTIKNNKKMRFGYTTGSCAAAAAKGAVEMLLENRQAGKVQLITPKGILLELDILHTERGAGWAYPTSTAPKSMASVLTVTRKFGVCTV